MQTERHQLIDNLRGLAILVIILTHTTVFFLQDKVAAVLWNWSHFAVPIFLFCSTYLFFKKGFENSLQFMPYFKKRFLRLVVPYFIFLVFFLISLFFIAPKILTAKYILQSIFLIGGVDINWLVLLFLYITVLSWIFVWLYKKSQVLFWAFFVVSFGSSIWLLTNHFPYSYKLIMWLPWSIMLYFTWFYTKIKRYWLLVTSSLLFVLAYIFQTNLQHSLILIDNKYPPNIFYLSYGITILLLLSFFDKYIFANKFVKKILFFFSKYSYSIFFLHYTVLTIFAVMIKQWQLNWVTFFVLVLAVTVLLQSAYNALSGRINKA